VFQEAMRKYLCRKSWKNGKKIAERKYYVKSITIPNSLCSHIYLGIRGVYVNVMQRTSYSDNNMDLQRSNSNELDIKKKKKFTSAKKFPHIFP